MKTKQIELWEGSFGDVYQERNPLTEKNIVDRNAFWGKTLKNIYVTNGALPLTYLEIGAGEGGNLIAINNVFNNKVYNIYPQFFAIEVNSKAREKLQKIERAKIFNDLESFNSIHTKVDMVFTMGCLIHIHPAHVLNTMKYMYDHSNRYILCAEYFSPETREIKYHGEADALWLADYGSMWLDNFPLRILGYGFEWKRWTGLDNLTVWVMEKTQ